MQWQKEGRRRGREEEKKGRTREREEKRRKGKRKSRGGKGRSSGSADLPYVMILLKMIMARVCVLNSIDIDNGHSMCVISKNNTFSMCIILNDNTYTICVIFHLSTCPATSAATSLISHCHLINLA
ncbi:hypothetical protein M9H77_02374 [Catharanthus roseus]|uniref:Uncharacterized protein n=1 Tax=Catharanthus roseus TaxID=4058 RepID=A0ACC0C8I7_CATRO|nr:hypothetical protein M9H77_02374 [Catharanthus roseus]